MFVERASYLWKENAMKRFGVLLASAALGAALVASSPAAAFRGGGSFGGGGFHGGFGGGSFHGGFGGGMPGGRMFTGRSVFVPGGNRFVGAPFAGRHAFVNRRFFDEGRRDRFEDRFRHRHFFVNGFDSFAFFGLPFAYDYAAYGNGCWRWDGWQWINICYDYGSYNYGY
jgi:hypothetical protein